MVRTRGFRNRRRREGHLGVDFSAIMFVTLVGIWVVSRIDFLIAIAAAPDCQSIQPALLGHDRRIDGILDTVAVAGMAALGLISVNAFACWQRGHVSPIGIVLGTVNAAIACLLIVQWLAGWSFFNPDAWQARLVMASGPTVKALYLDDVLGGWNEYEGKPGWSRVGEDAYFNEEIGILAQEETIKSCFPASFVRQNLLNMNPSGRLPNGVPIAAMPDEVLEKRQTAYIFYDRYGQYLTSDTYWFHDEYPVLQRRDAERDASGRDVDPLAVLDLIEASLEWQATGPTDLRPYTLEEINEMVEGTWDREAPLP